ncbi:MAG: hypothetical protein HYZ14_04230 [Bacteroidetes bacterium]|nr:hypothetical protein [Bacteroidota bacterium]
MTKKFFKTYFGIPDKQNRVDVGFERGYRNIVVRFNGNDVALFNSAADILTTREITTPDNRLIHLKFLRESTDFEVFLDGIQIDNSETSPKKVIAHLKWPIYISMSWYIIVLLFSFYYAPFLYSMVLQKPLMLLTNIAIFYLITSTMLVLLTMIISLIWLNKGNTVFYMIAFIVVAGDLFFGAFYQLTTMFTFGGGFQILMLFALLLPVLFKSAAVGSFYRNRAKFKQYVHMSSLTKQKTNPDLVDI